MWLATVKGHKLKPCELKESDKDYSNPARGWYRIITYDLSKEIKQERLQMVREMLDPAESLVLLIIDIGFYKDREIPAEGIEKMQRLIDSFGEDRSIILRVTYDHEGRAYQKEPDSFLIVKRHLEQVGEFVRQNKERLFVYQGLLVGNWGEMHSSRYISSDRLKVLADLMQKKMNGIEHMPLAVRCPYQWRRFHDKKEQSDAGMSLFDDAIFGSETDMGTFGKEYAQEKEWEQPWEREAELKFIEKCCDRLPFGGEAVFGDGYVKKLSQEALVEQLRKMQLSYLNCQHDLKILDYWKQEECTIPGVFKGKSMYDYIGAHLGYRFVVCDVKKKLGGRIAFYVENRGFANLCLEASLILTWEYDKTKAERVLDEDFSICSGKGKWYVTSLKGIEGEVCLRIRSKSDGSKIRFANEDLE